MSSNVNIYDAPPLRRAGVFDTTTTAGGYLTHTHQRISWAAIFGGVTLVVAVQLLLSLLGAGIGLGSGVKEAAKPIAQAAGVSPEMLQQQAQAYLQPTNPDAAKMTPQERPEG